VRALAGAGRRVPALPLAFAGCALGFVVLAVADSISLKALPAAGAVITFAAFHRRLLAWRTLTAALVAVVLFIPMRTYTLPIQVSATFKLDPYRLFVAFVVSGWIAALLADPRVRARASGLERALLLIGLSVIASIVVNIGSIQALGVTQEMIKSVVFFASFFFLFYIVVSVVRSADDVDRLLRVLVAGGAVVGACAIYEAKTGYNVFDHLRGIAPFLQVEQLPSQTGDIGGFNRGGEVRVYASAAHPIALGVLLVLLLPISIYLAERKRRWAVAAVILLLAALATVSRTGIVMLVVIGLVYLYLRPRWVRRAWPAVIPALIVVHFALPHTLGILKSSILPSGGVKALVAEQQSSAGSARAAGRLADVIPTLNQVAATDPLVGVGFGSRVVEGPLANARILDDQWLGTLLETGLAGFGAWIWLFVRFLRRTGRAARSVTGPRGSLLVALTASVASFGVGMFLFDALAFTQVTAIFLILLAVGCVVQHPLRRERASA
jgi:hypothetical protein